MALHLPDFWCCPEGQVEAKTLPPLEPDFEPGPVAALRNRRKGRYSDLHGQFRSLRCRAAVHRTVVHRKHFCTEPVTQSWTVQLTCRGVKGLFSREQNARANEIFGPATHSKSYTLSGNKHREFDIFACSLRANNFPISE